MRVLVIESLQQSRYVRGHCESSGSQALQTVVISTTLSTTNIKCIYKHVYCKAMKLRLS